MDKQSNHRFQVDLRGIIDLLGNNLYSNKSVFIREMLQNAVDAIIARQQHELKFIGRITIDLFDQDDSQFIEFKDNGIGLTEDEIHSFLSTIGASIKRSEIEATRSNFLGQFGIGILSCFMVSDEIVVITKSVTNDSTQLAHEWTGKSDGTYSIRVTEQDISAGTKVIIKAKPDCTEFFTFESVVDTTRYYGELLPFQIQIKHGAKQQTLNDKVAPLRKKWGSPIEEREGYLEWGRVLFSEDFFDAIPLYSMVGGIRGIAFIIPYNTMLGTRQKHRVYLKNMLLSESVDNLLPDWAFFVKCIINADGLRPTASRESFYEDDIFDSARNCLGDILRGYIVDLASTNPRQMQQLISIHYHAIKALTAENHDLLKVLGDWLPFETSLGKMRLGEIRSREKCIYYVPQVDRFRQIAPIAASQSLLVVNAGYSYDTEIIEVLGSIYGNETEVFDTDQLTNMFHVLSIDEQDDAFNFQKQAEKALSKFNLNVKLRKYDPVEIPVFYLPNRYYDFRRSKEKSKEMSNEFFSSILDAATSEMDDEANADLCLNYNNTLIKRLMRSTDSSRIRRIVQILYIQSLLLGHYQLNQMEMDVLNKGLLDLLISYTH